MKLGLLQLIVLCVCVIGDLIGPSFCPHRVSFTLFLRWSYGQLVIVYNSTLPQLIIIALKLLDAAKVTKRIKLYFNFCKCVRSRITSDSFPLKLSRFETKIDDSCSQFNFKEKNNQLKNELCQNNDVVSEFDKNLKTFRLLTIPSEKLSNIREWVFVIQFLCTSLSFVFWNFSFAVATSKSSWGRLSFRGLSHWHPSLTHFLFRSKFSKFLNKWTSKTGKCEILVML